MPKVFISYRRNDSAGITGRLDDRLVQHFGRESVFRDVDTIPPGVDFRKHLTDAVQECDVLLAVIGKRWLTTRRGGVRRIDDAKDFVRIEVEAALVRGIPVVPVLVEGATMPQADMLPTSLQDLVYRNAVSVDAGRDFHIHVDRLISGIGPLAAQKSAPTTALTVPDRTIASSAPVNAEVSTTSSVAGAKEGNQIDGKVIAPRRLVLPFGPRTIKTLRSPIDGAETVMVLAGEFLMGSDMGNDYRMGDQLPQRKVYLDNYRIYKTPVTVAQYRKFCEATKWAMPDAPSWGWQDDYPIVNVSWKDAQAYCEWACVALPTEAQWEKAARGTDGREYPWGNEWDTSKCHCSTTKSGDAQSTTAVGRYPSGASPYGCLDMAGNVMEWCADWFQWNYYEHGPDRNPTGPEKGTSHVLRGGCWMSKGPFQFRCAYRHRLRSGAAITGFRCVARADSR